MASTISRFDYDSGGPQPGSYQFWKNQDLFFFKFSRLFFIKTNKTSPFFFICWLFLGTILHIVLA